MKGSFPLLKIWPSHSLHLLGPTVIDRAPQRRNLNCRQRIHLFTQLCARHCTRSWKYTANKRDMIPALKELSMAAPSVKCQHAVEKDCAKVMSSPRALSPLGDHRSQVFVVTTKGAISD